ncbi:MAG: hypothetical protein K2G49_07070, partial [Muribaculum sp.]|nr:hypothetical protein [Muribaculum sp.]
RHQAVDGSPKPRSKCYMAYDQFDIDQTPVLQPTSSEKDVPVLHIPVSNNKNRKTFSVMPHTAGE